MSEREAVLFANDAFYLCFAGEDVDGMDALWASDAAGNVYSPRLKPSTDAKKCLRAGAQ